MLLSYEDLDGLRSSTSALAHEVESAPRIADCETGLVDTSLVTAALERRRQHLADRLRALSDVTAEVLAEVGATDRAQAHRFGPQRDGLTSLYSDHVQVPGSSAPPGDLGDLLDPPSGPAPEPTLTLPPSLQPVVRH